jgi:hypothetical protein
MEANGVNLKNGKIRGIVIDYFYLTTLLQLKMLNKGNVAPCLIN